MLSSYWWILDECHNNLRFEAKFSDTARTLSSTVFGLGGTKSAAGVFVSLDVLRLLTSTHDRKSYPLQCMIVPATAKYRPAQKPA